MRPTLPVQANHGHAHALVGAKHPLRVGQERDAAKRGYSRASAGAGL
jgi:hypothetical protein